MKECENASRKIRSNKGESITEVLVALLISAVALTMLASMIVSATHMIERTRDQMGQYYTEYNTLVSTETSDMTNGKLTFKTSSNGAYALSKDAANVKVAYATASVASSVVVLFRYAGVE